MKKILLGFFLSSVCFLQSAFAGVVLLEDKRSVSHNGVVSMPSGAFSSWNTWGQNSQVSTTAMSGSGSGDAGFTSGDCKGTCEPYAYYYDHKSVFNIKFSASTEQTLTLSANFSAYGDGGSGDGVYFDLIGPNGFASIKGVVQGNSTTLQGDFPWTFYKVGSYSLSQQLTLMPGEYQLIIAPYDWYSSSSWSFNATFADSQVVPVPGAGWFMVSALTGLIGLNRRKNHLIRI